MPVRELKDKDLVIGEPVSWHIYDSEGRLLVKKGMVLRSPRQVAKLLRLRAVIREKARDEMDDLQEDVSVNDALSPFHHIEAVLEKLNKIFRYMIYKPANPAKKIPDKLLALSNGIIELCEYDIDATIGSIHVGRDHDYTIIHPLHCAIISYVLATKVGIRDRRLNSILCAALTSNLGMFELQKVLENQPRRLTPEQKAEVEKHTMRSAILLRRNNTLDKLWVEIVLQHHEKQDGSGYPRGLKGKQFIREARILAVADRYHAMVSSRNYRQGLSPTEALKHIFTDRGKEVDEGLSALLIKEMGIYPPGAYVQLKNGETAIVARRGKNKMKPLVKSLVAPNGRYYITPRARDTAEKEYRIMGLTNPPKNYRHDLVKIWDYDLKG